MTGSALTNLKHALERNDHAEVVACVRESLKATSGKELSKHAEGARTTLIAFESETDNYPVREVRALWNAEALSTKDFEIADYVAKMRQHLLQAIEVLQFELG